MFFLFKLPTLFIQSRFGWVCTLQKGIFQEVVVLTRFGQAIWDLPLYFACTPRLDGGGSSLQPPPHPRKLIILYQQFWDWSILIQFSMSIPSFGERGWVMETPKMIERRKLFALELKLPVVFI